MCRVWLNKNGDPIDPKIQFSVNCIYVLAFIWLTVEMIRRYVIWESNLWLFVATLILLISRILLEKHYIDREMYFRYGTKNSDITGKN